MESIRQSKVGRLVQKELGIFLQQEGQEYAPGVMLSVTIVRMSPDLGYAKVYLSVFPSKEPEKIISALNKSVKSIRYLLGKKVRHQLRIVPELMFFLDDSLDYAEKIEDLLNN